MSVKRRRSRSAKQDISDEASNSRTKQVKSKRKYRKRKFPILARVIVILALLSFSLILGLMFGYGVIGDGEPKDVLNRETWQHIFDIVKKTE